MALKENYKDDILDTSQNVKRKYQMENNGDGTVSFTDVTEYTQQGDSFGASDMNAVNSEVNEVVNNLGAKNMLPNNATTQTINGITFTVNNDGSVTVNGTASSVASLFLIGSTSAWGSNQYKNCILNGCPSGGSNDSYRIVMQTSSDGSAISKTYLEDGNGVLIDDDNQYCKIYIRIAGGYTANNLIFKPMIRSASIADDTYAPYAQTNKELTANLNGFKFYPTGTGIVGLIADDSAYTDEDGNYVVWGTATANQLVEDNPNTYKSVPSTEDTRGKVGADTATPFSGKVKYAHGTGFGTFNIGFRPLQIFALSSAIGSSTAKKVEALYYDQNYSSNKITVYGSYDSRTEAGSIIRSNNASSPYMIITDINDNGFTITSSVTWSGSCVWSAFGIEE